MGILTFLLTLVYIFVCIGLIFFVLIQSSKGSGLSGAFGALGGSDSLFGATGSYSLVVKISVGLAVAFLVLSVLFGFLPKSRETGLMARYGSVQEAVQSYSTEGEGTAAPAVGGSEPSPQK